MISVTTLRSAVPNAVGVDTVLLNNMIERARTFIETQTRRYFGPITEATEYLSGSGSRHLRLSEGAITNDDGEVGLIEERAYPGATATVIPVAAVVVRQGEQNTSSLVRTDGSVWTTGLEYAVTYERGYGVDAGPPDIAQLIIDLVEARLAPLGAEVLQSETIGGYSYTRFKESDLDLIDDGWKTINAWRRAVFA